jgi:CheY-like chemotaxis protein
MSKNDTSVESSLSSDISADAEPEDWIVVVDDSPSNLSIICGVLNKLGFGTVSYRDGQLALDGMASLRQDRREKICAIFSDLMMPRMDGIALLREVRKSDKTRLLPFVIVTSSTEKSTITEALSLKISGYLLKPITAKTITDTVLHLFPNRQLPSAEHKISIRRV